VGRFACLWIPDVPLAAALRAEPELRGRSVAIAEAADARASIVGGTLRGLTVAQARTARTDLVVRPVSLEGMRSAQEALCDVARSITPRIEETAVGVASLDVVGTEALYPTSGGLLTALEKRLGEVGLETARTGIGPTRTVALLAARHRDGGHTVPSDGVKRFLSPLPLDLLDPPLEVFDRLTRWGVRTLGELARIPSKPLGARLGEEGVQLARRARGEDTLPFKPCPPRPRFEESGETGYPVDNLEALAFLLRGALERLARRLHLRGLATRELLVELELASGETFARPVGLGAPTTDGATLAQLARLVLEKDPPREPIERLRVIATPGNVESIQLDLFRPPLPAPAELAVTVARLEALCGPDQVGAPGLEEGHRPDAARVTSFEASPELPPPHDSGAPPAPAMALRALRPPQPIRVWGDPGMPERVEPSHKWNTPGEIAGGRVIQRAGPWRLFGEWWGEAPFARDYFDVELSDGGVYRIYRSLEDESWLLDGVYD
jgi:protein ImuB